MTALKIKVDAQIKTKFYESRAFGNDLILLVVFGSL